MTGDPTKEQLGAYFTWQLSRGASWDEAVAAAIKKYKMQDPALFEQGRELAENMEETVTRYEGLSATDRLIDAFGNTRPTTLKVGVRFLVWVEESPGSFAQKSIAFEVGVNTSIALVEELARAEAERMQSKGTSGQLATRAQVGEKPIQILSILYGPLPRKEGAEV